MLANGDPTDEVWLTMLADREGLPLPDSAAGLVLGLDPSALSQQARLAAVAVAERAIAALTAAQAALIAEVALVERALPSPVDDPERELVADALGLSPLAAAGRVHHALTLRQRLPRAWFDLRVGRITPAAARAIADETSCLTLDQAQAVTCSVLGWARVAPPGAVRRRTAALAGIIDPAGASERHRRARTERGVVVRPEGDGMASLWWLADAVTITRARELIDATARASVDTCPDGLNAARSDALGRLLLHSGGSEEHPSPTASARRPVVAVHVQLRTLLGADNLPAEVPGLGPMPADAVRALASEADWQLFLHSADGRVAGVASRAYTPTDSMVALVVARDRTCVFPRCQQPAYRCDLDHREPFNHRSPELGGATHPDNLQALCRRHHRLKTSRVWTVGCDPDGVLEWRGPLGTRARVEHDPDPPWYQCAVL